MERFCSILRTPLLLSLVVTFVIGMVVPTVSARQELVAHWPFDESTKDVSGNGHHGKVKGGEVAYAKNAMFAQALGGGADWIEVAMTNKLRFWDTVTVMGWVYLGRAAKHDPTLIMKNGPDVKKRETWSIGVRRIEKGKAGLLPNAGKAWFDVRTQAELGRGTAYTNSILFAERWYHLAGSYDGQTVRLYADGRLNGEVEVGCARPPCAAPMLENNEAPISIGGTPVFPKQRLGGKIDEVAIFRGVLTEAQIKTAMTEGIPAVALTVEPVGKLATTLGKIKQDYGIAD